MVFIIYSDWISEHISDINQTNLLMQIFIVITEYKSDWKKRSLIAILKCHHHHIYGIHIMHSTFVCKHLYSVLNVLPSWCTCNPVSWEIINIILRLEVIPIESHFKFTFQNVGYLYINSTTKDWRKRVNGIKWKSVGSSTVEI